MPTADLDPVPFIRELMPIIDKYDDNNVLPTLINLIGLKLGGSACCETHAWSHLAVTEQILRNAFIEGLKTNEKI